MHTTTATVPTAATTTTAGTILALDLGKFKTVACAYQGDPSTARFESLTTDRQHLRKLFAKHQPGVVAFEACALSGWVADRCAERSLPCKVANTASEAWKFKHTKRKTDKDDAPRGAKAWTALGLEGIGQHAKALADCAPDERWRGLLALALTEYRQAKELIDQAEAKLDALAKAEQGVHLLQTIPGVGPRTAETVVAYLGDASRFDNGKQVSA